MSKVDVATGADDPNRADKEQTMKQVLGHCGCVSVKQSCLLRYFHPHRGMPMIRL